MQLAVFSSSRGIELLYDTSLVVLYPVTVGVILAMAGIGVVLGNFARSRMQATELGTFTGAALGLLALLLGFSFSLALSRYDSRRGWVLEETNAISSTANSALMLPSPAQRPILNLLHEYAVIRRDLRGGWPNSDRSISGVSA